MTQPAQPSAGARRAGPRRRSTAAAPGRPRAAVLATSAVWVAAGVAALLGTGSWTTPAWSLALLPRLLTDGVAALVGPGASTVGFVAVLVVLAAAAIGVAVAGLAPDRATSRPGHPVRCCAGTELGDLTGHAAQTKAGELRPHLTAPSARQVRAAIRWESALGAWTDATCGCPGKTSP